MKRRKLFTIVGSVCLMVIIAALPFMAACAAPAPTPAPTPTPTPVVPTPVPAPEKVIEISFSTVYPVLHPMNYDCYAVWCEELDKRTGGRTETTLFSGQSLAPPKENWDAITAGVADMGECWGQTTPGVFPVSDLYLLPFITGSAATASPAIYECTITHPELMNDYKKAHLLSQHTSAIMDLHTTKKLIKTLEDIRGMIIAGESKQCIDWLNSFGAAAEVIDLGTAGYLSLEKGIVEGGIWPMAPLRPNKLTDFLNYHTMIGLNFVFSSQVMNKETWESLPEDIQNIITDITGHNLGAFGGYTLTNGTLVDMDWMKDKGDEFYTLPPDEMKRWADQVAFAMDEYIADMADIGVDGTKLWADLKKIVAEFEANPYPEQEWWGPQGVGRYGSPNRPGGWD